jgi:Phosphoenolpyruvate carboxylase
LVAAAHLLMRRCCHNRQEAWKAACA